MTVTVKVDRKGQLAIPQKLWSRMGVSGGATLEAQVEKGRLVLTSVTEEYTPAQRRALDRKLVKGLEDIRMGRLHGPFTPQEADKFLRSEFLRRKGAPK